MDPCTDSMAGRNLGDSNLCNLSFHKLDLASSATYSKQKTTSFCGISFEGNLLMRGQARGTLIVKWRRLAECWQNGRLVV